MSADSYTEVTSESWSSRIGGSFKGIILGVILFIVSFPVLFLNEQRAVKTYKTLKEGEGAVESIAVDAVDPGKEGALVHMTGEAVTADTLSDPEFGVLANAIKLRRDVEMYQWRQNSESKTRKKVGGGTETTTTYTYSKAWASSAISSDGFKKPEGHQNPGSMPYESKQWMAENVTLGAFRLSSGLIRKIDAFTTLAVASIDGLPEAVRAAAKVYNGGYYIGESPTSPEIGDLKVTFHEAKPATVSIIARQKGHSFEPYKARAGGTIELLRVGGVGAEAMFESAHKGNRILTWVLRFVGFFLMMAGIRMVLRPLSVLADVLPFLGSLVGAGTGLIAMLVAGSLSLLTVAVSWIVVRPVLGLSLVVVMGALVVVCRAKMKAGAERVGVENNR